ncbi:MAG: hypothetical protein KF799_01265 [Bdellovibrionales bacterium]|nr:hypothetical protein [Bdellovibrionales bacterium]
MFLPFTVSAEPKLPGPYEAPAKETAVAEEASETSSNAQEPTKAAAEDAKVPKTDADGCVEAKPNAAAPDVKIPAITKASLAQISKALKLSEFKGRKFTRKIKIAILDNGFNGWESEVGKSLPAGTKYCPGKASRADEITDPSLHGLFMAQVVAAVVKNSGAEADYEMRLFNAYGITKFGDAVDTLVREKFDLVLYSQVWEYGGNGDGKGFINAIVDKALAAGVIWINASGNYGHLTKLAPVDGRPEGLNEYIMFKNKDGKTSDSAIFHCKPAPGKKKCSLRLVLSWNDFKDDPEAGTDKDLDVIVQDDAGKEIAVGDRNQVLAGLANDPKASKVPRELIETDVVPGKYKVRIKIKSKNFSASQDVARITVSGPGIELADASVGETLLPPGDNPGVLTVGAADDFQTNVSEKLKRPDIYLTSAIALDNDSIPFSTSNAAALTAGVSVLQLGTGVDKTRAALLEKLKVLTVKPIKEPPANVPPPQGQSPNVRVAQPRAPRGYDQLDFDVYRRRPYMGEPMPDQRMVPRQGQPRPPQNCVRRVRMRYLYPVLQGLLEQGGAEAIMMRGRVAILVNYNYACYQNLCPQPGQRLVITPQGLTLMWEQQMAYGLPQDTYEVITRAIPVCR